MARQFRYEDTTEQFRAHVATCRATHGEEQRRGLVLGCTGDADVVVEAVVVHIGGEGVDMGVHDEPESAEIVRLASGWTGFCWGGDPTWFESLRDVEQDIDASLNWEWDDNVPIPPEPAAEPPVVQDWPDAEHVQANGERWD